MILTVTLNLAVDVTYRVDAIRLGETTQVAEVARRAGGKGVNVARVLRALGHDVVVSGLAGGSTGDAIRADLAAAGLTDQTMRIDGPSRVTLIVVDETGRATGFSEPGPTVSGDEWQRWQAEYGMLLEQAEAVVLSGSLPPGAPVDGYAQMTATARGRDRPVLLDAGGEALARGITACPAIVKVNVDELAAIEAGSDPLAAAAALCARGPGAVVVTDGPRGMVAVTPDGRWRCAPPEPVRGNPTGAGDAAAAALIAGAVRGSPWPQRLAEAVAVSAAAAAAPLAGSFDGELYRRLRGEVRAEPA